MDPQLFLREMKKFSVVRPASWQGPSARGGPILEMMETDVESSENTGTMDMDTVMSESQSSSSLWTRLSNATGSATHGAAVVRLMQKHLLEHVDNLPLDEIELMARRTA